MEGLEKTRLVRYLSDWNGWRQWYYGNRWYKMAVLFKIRKSPAFEFYRNHNKLNC